MDAGMKALFIAWEQYHARTARLGSALGAQVCFISRMGRVRGPRLVWKYWLQGVETARRLLRERPDAILVQTPPVFPALLAALYAAWRPGTRLVLDAHSGTFLSPKWKWALPLMRWCARRADMTVVHMPSLLAAMRAWGVPAMEMGYVFEPAAPAARGSYPLPPGTNIVVPSSFNQDEPLALIYAAARLAPEARFHLTGDARRVPPESVAARPENVTFTGYLEVSDYQALLRGATAVLALTTQDQTFQTGGAEAVWLARPLIISDWPELRAVFARGAVFAAPTAESIAAGVRAAAANGERLQTEIRALKAEFDRELAVKLRRLRAVLDPGAPPAARRLDRLADEEGQA
jgi:hypothetical protein